MNLKRADPARSQHDKHVHSGDHAFQNSISTGGAKPATHPREVDHLDADRCEPRCCRYLRTTDRHVRPGSAPKNHCARLDAGLPISDVLAALPLACRCTVAGLDAASRLPTSSAGYLGTVAS